MNTTHATYLITVPHEQLDQTVNALASQGIDFNPETAIIALPDDRQFCGIPSGENGQDLLDGLNAYAEAMREFGEKRPVFKTPYADLTSQQRADLFDVLGQVSWDDKGDVDELEASEHQALADLHPTLFEPPDDTP